MKHLGLYTDDKDIATKDKIVAGGGSPSGVDTSVQYNNNGSFAGATGAQIVGGSLNISDFEEFDVTTTPATPSANNIRLYARSRAGKLSLNTIGASGMDTPLQNAFYGNNIWMWLPSNSTTASIAFGSTWTARNTTGAQATPAKANTNILTNMSRATFSSTAVVNTCSGTQSTQTTVCRSANSGYGGFFYFARFGFDVWNGTGQQVVLGLNTLNGVIAGEPSAMNNSILLAKDSTDTNMFIQTRNASAVTRLDTGIAPSTGVVWDLMFSCKPNDTKVIVRMVNVGTGAVILDNVELTDTLPVNTTYMYAYAGLRNTGTAINSLSLNRIYIETDI